MGLIDPPKYVAIPPGLIYGAEDLEREHYKALLQVVGWLWVTRRHGKALGTTTRELMERWGVAERTVYHRLQRFAELGYLGVRVDGRRCFIRPGPRMEGEARASSLHEEGSGASSLHGYNTSGGGSGFMVDGSDLKLPTTINADVFKLLKMRGVHPRKAEELAGDVWVSEERVEAWWGDLVRQEKARPGRIRDMGAVLAANLREHYEPPGLRKVEVRERVRVERCGSDPASPLESGDGALGGSIAAAPEIGARVKRLHRELLNPWAGAVCSVCYMRPCRCEEDGDG